MKNSKQSDSEPKWDQQTALRIVNKEQHKLWLRIVMVVAVLFVLGGVFGLKRHATAPGQTTDQGSSRNYTQLYLAGREFKVTLATTVTAHEKGLSGTPNLPPDHGMLFVFETSQKACFWMKDMHYNLDMIWLDESKQVSHIEHDVSPATYPTLFCGMFPARYVLEVNSGVAKSLNLRDGDRVTF